MCEQYSELVYSVSNIKNTRKTIPMNERILKEAKLIKTIIVLHIFMVSIAIIIAATKQLLQAAGNGCVITFD